MQGKKILLGITGSIAAYKAAFLTRLLIKQGAEVQVLMTPAATKFITPLTLATLSKRPVHSQVSDEESWNNHVEMGLWADAMVIAPTTATTIAKLANGMADNVIVATYLSARCPVFFAPAMDLDMWVHPATLQNVRQLQSYGNHLIPVGHGELASGLVGAGRMAEPEDIVQFLEDYFDEEARRNASSLANKTIVITAGPTFEDIDPVRYIGNRSSGRMGIAIAEEAAKRWAKVKLVLGPSMLEIAKTFEKDIEVIHVRNAEQMFEATVQNYPNADVAVMAAAVADYRPKIMAAEKIKKKTGDMNIKLVRTPDIAARLGTMKQKGQINVGFALETENELKNAQRKLVKKNFDFIVLNSLKDKGAGFQHDTNKVTFVDAQNNMTNFELKSKSAVAVDILDKVETYFQ